MSSPVAPGGASLDDIDAALDSVMDEDTTAPTDLTPASPASVPPAPAGQEPPETPPESGEPQDDAVSDASAPPSGAAPAPPTDDPTTSPLTGGTPFAFRVDGREVTPEGALQFPDGSVLFPAKAWAQLQGQHLGDRGVWRQKEAKYQQQVQQVQQEAQRHVADQVGAVTLERDQARAALEEFQKILAAGPEALVQWAENFSVNRPALEARMEARALQAKLQHVERQGQQWQQQRTEQEDQQHAETVLRPAFEAHFDRALDTMLSGPYAGVAGTPQEKADLRAFLWDTMRGQLFYEAVPNAKNPGDFGFRLEVLEQVLGREKARHEAVAKQTTALTDAAKRNAAATAPTPKTARQANAAPSGKKKPVDVDEALARVDWLSDDDQLVP